MNHDSETLNDRDGEAFLAELDAALNGEAAGPHAETVAFAAKLEKKFPHADTATEEQIRAAILSAKPSVTAALARAARPASRAKIAVVERRFGVLDAVAIAAIVLLSFGAFSIWKSQQHAREQRAVNTVAGGSDGQANPEPAPKPKEDTPAPQLTMKQKLHQHITADFTEMSFEEAMAKCAELGHVTLNIDPQFKPAQPVKYSSLNLRDMELRCALAWVCAQFGASYSTHNNTTIDVASNTREQNVQLQIYDVSDLKPTLLVKILRERLLAAEFADPATSLEEAKGRLVIMQSPEVHHRISEILDRVRSQWAARQITFDFSADATWKTALDEKLARKVSFTWEDKTLRDALSSLASELKVTIIPDPKLALDAPASLKITSMKAALALSWVTKLAGSATDYIVKDGAVYIPQEDPHNEFRMFSIRDIADNDAAGKTIADLIINGIHAESWGAGKATNIEINGGYLLVMQSPAVQDSIAGFLNSLLETKNAVINTSDEELAQARKDDQMLKAEVSVDKMITTAQDLFDKKAYRVAESLLKLEVLDDAILSKTKSAAKARELWQKCNDAAVESERKNLKR